MTWAIVVETHARKKLQREPVTRRAELVRGSGSRGAASSIEPFLGAGKQEGLTWNACYLPGTLYISPTTVKPLRNP